MADSLAQPDYLSQPNNTNLDHIPGFKGWPLVGNVNELYRSTLSFAQRRYERFGEVSRINLGPLPGVLALGPENAQKIFLDSDKNFSSRMGYDYALTEFFGLNLLCRDFDDHRFQRRVMQTSFKNDAMKRYVELMNPVLDNGIKSWDFSADFRFYPNIKQLLLKMACKVFYGVDETSGMSSKLSQAFIDITVGQEGIIRKEWPGLKYNKGVKGKRFLREYIAELLPERKANPGSDMLSHMCQETKPDGEPFSDEELIDHASFLLFAAHDTTTSTLTHMMYYLALLPEWQDRIRQEGREHTAGRSTLEYSDLNQLPLLDAAFHESQRLHPSVNVLVRRTVRDSELGGFHIPANTMVFQTPMFNNRMEDYWSNPTEFDPERFLPDHAEHKRHAFCYIPFGGGAHKCIGMHFGAMQAKLFLHQFLQQFSFSLPEGHEPEFVPLPLPKLKDNLPLIVERI